MKKSILFIGFLCSSILIFAQDLETGIQFFKGSFEDAKEKARVEGKLIFVDAYAVWCGPCKRMSSSVFPNEEVGQVYNAVYVSMKIDMEKPMGRAFGQNYPVSAYPTLFYLDADGNILEKVVGGRSVEDFILLGKKFSSKASPGGKNYAKLYEEGDRSAETVYNYISRLNKTGKNSLSIVNEFLKTQQDWKSEWPLRILFEGTTEADSKIFDLFIQHQKELEKFYTREEIVDRAIEASRRTVLKAAEFEYPTLLQTAKEKVKTNFPKEYKSFQIEAELMYAAENQDSKAFIKHMNEVEKGIQSAERLRIMARIADIKFPNNTIIRTKAITWLEKALKQEESSESWFYLAKMYLKNENKSAAAAAAQRALKIAEDKKENTYPIKTFIDSLNG
jgi:thiol-disulfide isomerase/thioredoxin